jgi:hypothetical protein
VDYSSTWSPSPRTKLAALKWSSRNGWTQNAKIPGRSSASSASTQGTPGRRRGRFRRRHRRIPARTPPRAAASVRVGGWPGARRPGAPEHLPRTGAPVNPATPVAYREGGSGHDLERGRRLPPVLAQSLRAACPETLSRVERIAPVQIGQGTTTREISDELLEALTDAYREAASGKIGG